MLLALLVLAALGGTWAAAQSIPEFLWAKGGGGTGNEWGRGVGVDGSGNSYHCWSFTGTIHFAGSDYTSGSPSNSDFMVAKLGPDGDCVWARQVGGAGYDAVSAIATDSSGNSYVTGRFMGTVNFGSHPATALGTGDVFVAKIDTNGNWLWATSSYENSYGGSRAIAIDSSGNSCIIGNFSGTTRFCGTTLYSNGGDDVFVARLDANGNWFQTRGYGGGADDSGIGIAADGNGNWVITGWFSGSVLFSGTWLTSAGEEDGFVAKLDGLGNCSWAKNISGSSYQRSNAIACDAGGNSWVTGDFMGATHFGSIDLDGLGLLDVFVAKLDPAGNWLWAEPGGGFGSDESRAICVDGSGNACVTGGFCGTASFGPFTVSDSDFYNSDVFVARIDGAGDWLWALGGGGPDDEYGQGIAVDASGNSYVNGHFRATSVFGPTTLRCHGGVDALMAKVSSQPMPAGPRMLTIARSGNNIQLNWQPVTRTTRGELIEGAVHYQVLGSTSSPAGPYGLLVQTDATSHLHVGALSQRCRFYRVKTVTGGG